MHKSPRIMVAICTFQRNDPLRVLLDALRKVAATTAERARIGIVVVDDDPDQGAREVVNEFGQAFALGCLYRTSGRKNISLARNIAIDAASAEADWVAMIDDDCEPEPRWLCDFLDVIEATGADCVTGPMHLRVPPSSPAWLSEQPFFDDVRLDIPDREPMNIAATNNSIIRAGFVRDHPHIRFDPELGRLGGEDMVFYRTAFKAGLRIRFARSAGVWGNEPPHRATFKHQVRYRFWLGNTEFVTNFRFGETSRSRLFFRGAKRLSVALGRPLSRLMKGQRPQLLYCVASVAGAIGLICGTIGLKKLHPEDKG